MHFQCALKYLECPKRKPGGYWYGNVSSSKNVAKIQYIKS